MHSKDLAASGGMPDSSTRRQGEGKQPMLGESGTDMDIKASGAGLGSGTRGLVAPIQRAS